MRLTTHQRYNLRTGMKITGAGILIALVYPVFADGFGHWLPFLISALIGLLGGIIVAVLELDLFNTIKPNRPFLVKVVIRTLAYTVAFALIVPLVKVFCESMYFERGVLQQFRSEEFQHFLKHEDYGLIVFYALVFIALIIFTREINRKLGQGILWNYVIGRYLTPREETRIFMLIDLRESTKIAETMPPTRYHNLIRDFFKDITEPVIRNHGVIYDYVGDQARITWSMKDPERNADCVRTYHLVRHAILSRREYYLEAYGIIPTFTTAIHCGRVVIGEIGDVKSEIVYTGDTIFELMLMEKCISDETKGSPALISDRLLGLIKLPALYEPSTVTEIIHGSEKLTISMLEENEITVARR